MWAKAYYRRKKRHIQRYARRYRRGHREYFREKVREYRARVRGLRVRGYRELTEVERMGRMERERVYQAAYFQRNKERIREYRREYYRRKREEVRGKT